MEHAAPKDDEHDRLADILSSAFVFPLEDAPEWFARAGHENIRVLRQGGGVVAGYIQIPMGQFIVGRSVPMVGIAGVGVALEARGAHVALTMMQACVRELAERGVALSTLYPSTQTLYRGAGWERAGKSSEYSLAVQSLDTIVPGDGLAVKRLSAEDEPAVKALYASVAHEIHGQLDRGPYMWSRVVNPRGRKVRGFGFYDGDSLEAYVYLSQHAEPFAPTHNLWATDLKSKTARGYAAIFRFVRSQRSLAEHLEFFEVPSVPFLNLLKESRYEEKAGTDWMARVCDVRSALEARGYPALVKASVALQIRDEIVPANDGVWTLEVDGGRGAAHRRGTAAATMDVRALAQVYMGYAAPSALARIGLVEATPSALRTLDGIFAAPIAGMPERF